MAGSFLKWLIPGVIAIVGGTSLALLQADPALTADLEMRSRAALGGEFDWANIRIDGRDAIVSGPATTEAEIESAVERLSTVAGLRVAQAELDLSSGPDANAAPSANAPATRASSSTSVPSSTGPSSSSSVPSLPAVPVVAPYLWSASKTAEGSVTLAGYVPSQAVEDLAVSRAGTLAGNTLAIASGEPAGFSNDVLAALGALAQLREGKAEFDGTSWSLSGLAASQSAGAAARAALATGGTRWTISISVVPSSPASSEQPPPSSAPSSIASDSIISLEPIVSPPSSAASSSASSSTTPSSTAPSSEALASSSISSSVAPSSSAPPSSLEPSASSLEPSSARLSSLEPAASSAAPPTASSAGSVEPPAAFSSSVETSTGEPSSSTQPASSEPPPSASSSSAGPLSSSSSEPASTPPGSSSAPTASASSSSSEAPAAAPPAPAPVGPPPGFTAEKTAAGAIVLAGAVPSAADADALAAKAGGISADALTPTAGLPQNFAAIALPALDALNALDEGSLGFDGARWSLTGKTTKQSTRDRVSAAIAALPGGTGWSVRIEIIPPLEVCRTRVAGIAERNAILFAPASATLTGASYAVLDELAADLALCPDAFVHVEGHTDADGAEDANLILSVSRAEAVVAALVERGVDEGRLYAEGFGESRPVASNDTRDGKQQNRRIAFRITED